MDFADVVRRQRAFFLSGATRPGEFRRAQLDKLLAAIQAHGPALSEALHSDLRKSAHEAFVTEIGLVQAAVRHARKRLADWMRPQGRKAPWLAWPARGWVQREPFGVALILGPWNYPIQLLLSPLVGAIAAGNCALLKPSELAPHSSAALARLIRETFPPEYVSLVEGESDVAQALLREKFDTIFFTGSTTVGRAVMTAAARHLTPVTLELGGKSPCIVCADAPVELAARRIAWGKFMNAGQTCVAPDFVLVEERSKAALLAGLARAITAFYGENPAASPAYGRIINQRHLDRLRGYLQAGTITHGGASDPAALYLAPTLVTDVPWDAPAMREEIFGPILPVLGFTTLEHVLVELRDRPAPLALYLFTRDRAVQAQVLAQTRSGGVCLNDTIIHMVGEALPFGGLGESGMGRYHGEASFDAFSYRRSVLRRALWADPTLRYPPPRVSVTALRRAFRFLLRD